MVKQHPHVSHMSDMSSWSSIGHTAADTECILHCTKKNISALRHHLLARRKKSHQLKVPVIVISRKMQKLSFAFDLSREEAVGSNSAAPGNHLGDLTSKVPSEILSGGNRYNFYGLWCKTTLHIDT